MLSRKPPPGKPVYRRPSNLEHGDPLQSHETLTKQTRIASIFDEFDSDTLKKSPSEEVLPRQHWDSIRKTSGKSKTGLCIVVPPYQTFIKPSEDAKPDAPLKSGAIFEDKSILYMYTSSSSGDTRTSSGFGAIGDQLVPAKRSSSKRDLRISDHPIRRPMVDGCDRGTDHIDLKNLVATSEADKSMYQVIIAGETGPLAIPSTPRICGLEELNMIPRRRRSHSDLIDRPISIARPSKDNIAAHMRGGSRSSSSRGRLIREISPEHEPEAWHRKGPSYWQMAGVGSTDNVYDPASFYLPTGVCFHTNRQILSTLD